MSAASKGQRSTVSAPAVSTAGSSATSEGDRTTQSRNRCVFGCALSCLQRDATSTPGREASIRTIAGEVAQMCRSPDTNPSATASGRWGASRPNSAANRLASVGLGVTSRIGSATSRSGGMGMSWSRKNATNAVRSTRRWPPGVRCPGSQPRSIQVRTVDGLAPTSRATWCVVKYVRSNSKKYGRPRGKFRWGPERPGSPGTPRSRPNSRRPVGLRSEDFRCEGRFGDYYGAAFAGIAQLVEHKLPKLGVAGPNPVSRSKISNTCAFPIVFPIGVSVRRITGRDDAGLLVRRLTQGSRPSHGIRHFSGNRQPS